MLSTSCISHWGYQLSIPQEPPSFQEIHMTLELMDGKRENYIWRKSDHIAVERALQTMQKIKAVVHLYVENVWIYKEKISDPCSSGYLFGDDAVWRIESGKEKVGDPPEEIKVMYLKKSVFEYEYRKNSFDVPLSSLLAVSIIQEAKEGPSQTLFSRAVKRTEEVARYQFVADWSQFNSKNSA